MSSYSKIEWTDASWNPIIGCTKISQGCKNCYAETLAERFRGVPNHPFKDGFDLKLIPKKLVEPSTWKKPRKIFVCSMSDLFHERIPIGYLKQVFSTMCNASRHTFQVLTKRSDRLLEVSSELPWTDNIWVGVSVESAEYTYRIKHLQKVPSRVRFISFEPLIGPIINLPLAGIDWVIVGGESGSKARPMDLEWARKIRLRCEKQKIPFFLKQLGGKNGKRGGDEALLDGKVWRQYPKEIELSPSNQIMR